MDRRGSFGLLGQLLAILLLIVVVEVAASTALYESAGDSSIREGRARRLAEHLVIARRLAAERPAAERAAVVRELASERYDIRWVARLSAPPADAPQLAEMRRQIMAWEPMLANSGLRLAPAGTRRSIVTGGLRLSDGSWLLFAASGILRGWSPALWRIALAGGAAALLLAIGGVLVRRALHPLHTLAEATTRIGVNAEVALEEQGTAEVRDLIRAFNAMQHRIHRLIADRTQALAAVGHDIRTPLARVQLRLDSIAEPQLRAALGADIGEMEAMIASLLAFLNGDSDPEVPVRIDLAVLAATVVDEATDRGETARYAGPAHLEARLRPVAMRRALCNLVRNAVRYGDAAFVTLDDQPDRIVLTVEDEGPGIPPERLADVLAPFARLDTARRRDTEGLGLGLAIVAQAVEREGGVLSLVNRAEGGLCATITLPRAALAPSGPADG